MKKFLLLAIAIFATSACAASPVNEDSDYVEGLDSSAVAHVLNDPAFLEAVKNDTEEDTQIYLQGNVLSRLMCLDLMDYYIEWHETGVRPEVPALPQPANPDPDNMLSLEMVQQQILADADADGTQGLRTHLGENKGCADISVQAGEYHGETIRVRIESLGL